MSDPMTVIAVAGGAPVTQANIEDLMKDFLLLETDDEKEFVIYLPADADCIGDAVLNTAKFLTDLGEGYIAIQGESSVKVKQLVRKAEEVLDPEGGADAAAYLIDILADAKEEGNETFLFLAWGDGDEAPDEVTQHLLELASDGDIPVKDLTAGLDDLDWDDEPDSAEDEVIEVEEVKPEKKPVKELKEEETELPDEAQADLPEQHKINAGHSPVAEIPDLITVLRFVFERLDHEDRANAAAQMQPAYNRPLTRAVQHHLSKLLIAENPLSGVIAAAARELKAAEPVQEPLPDAIEGETKARRGKARDTASDVVKVLINEKDKTARIREGRGRMKKGEEAHEMSRTEFDELIDSGEYTPY